MPLSVWETVAFRAAVRSPAVTGAAGRAQPGTAPEAHSQEDFVMGRCPSPPNRAVAEQRGGAGPGCAGGDVAGGANGLGPGLAGAARRIVLARLLEEVPQDLTTFSAGALPLARGLRVRYSDRKVLDKCGRRATIRGAPKPERHATVACLAGESGRSSAKSQH
jgi:hypothetical protein